jgi:acetyl esterase
MDGDALWKRLTAATDLPRIGREVRMRGGALVVDSFFRGIARLGRLHPQASPERHGVEVLRDVPYRDSGLPEHTLDVYRPVDRDGPRPAVLYVHGGGFRILSKDSHWLMGLAFARRGYVVFNINYRLAPQDPYPAAIEDVCHAFTWLARNAPRWGADPQRLVLAGESAGGNLVTALAVADAWRREEPWAKAVYDAPMRPLGVIAACGMLQVSDPERFLRRRRLPVWIYDRLAEVSEAYLGPDAGAAGCDLADPLCIIEGGMPDRALPPFHAFCGTRDPLLDDTRRLGVALEGLGIPCDVRIYPGEVHAFHAMLWRASAITCWRECFSFFERILDVEGGAQSAVSAPAG